METREILDNATFANCLWGLLFTGIIVVDFGLVSLSKRSGQSASIENQLGKLVTAGMTAYAGISKLRNQVKQTENKLVASKEKFESYLQESATSLNTKINRTMEFTRSGVRAIGSIMQNEKQGSLCPPVAECRLKRAVREPFLHGRGDEGQPLQSLCSQTSFVYHVPGTFLCTRYLCPS